MGLLYDGRNGKPFQRRIASHEISLSAAFRHDDMRMDAYAPADGRRKKNDAAAVFAMHDGPLSGAFFKQSLQKLDVFPASAREKRRPHITESLEMSPHEC